MIEITLEALVEAVQGTPNDKYKEHYQETFRGVSIDTRTLEKENLFVPFIGEYVDGHRFINSAFENGASVTLSENVEDLNKDVPVLHVDNGLVALQTLAKYYLNIVQPKVIAITGSNGKTTTKDMLECVLTPTFKVKKTIGNYNNEIGLPLTVLQLEQDTEISILEMGMDQAGDISFLTQMVTPNIAIITNVGESHIENLGSRENIAKAKYEIVEGLKSTGTFIYSKDYPLLENIVNKKVSYHIKTVGFDPDNDIVIKEVTQTTTGTEFQWNVSNDTIQIPQLGLHNAQNAAYALLTAQELGVSSTDAIERLHHLRVTSMRMEIIPLQSGATLINDAYNASRASMKSAINSIIEMQGEQKIIVLGDILELGSYSDEIHKDIGQFVNSHIEQFSHVYTYGENAQIIHDEITSENKTHLTQLEDIQKDLQKYNKLGTIILLKGSRGMKLETIASYL